ncbi:serine hydrolase [Rhodococcus marinonascens]|uniref:serine hydrolase n=1 Tax=Rhodococcus marinonascens TaxID=38311 RepID=UPI00093340A9|nr:serine hydrolase [Rhodococcus marinonascens]
MPRPAWYLAVAALLLGAALISTIPTDTNTVVATQTPDGSSTATNLEPLPAANVFPVAPLVERISAAVATASAARGADVSIAVLDRATGSYLESAGSQPIETASLSKLFIAAQLFHLDALGERPISQYDRLLLAPMLESSDDNAANTLWSDLGGSDIVPDVAFRYGLTSTTAPRDGMWWNTETTAADLVTFYVGLLHDRDGIGPDRSAEFLGYLRSATPMGTDGYDQRFGIPDGLSGEKVLGVKQGWMCCVASRWIHLSTGVIGEDNRYVLVVASRENITYDDGEEGYPDTASMDVTGDSSARHARDTVTDVVRTLFPSGVVDDWAKPQN